MRRGRIIAGVFVEVGGEADEGNPDKESQDVRPLAVDLKQI